jgi:hypothetical protein
VALGRRFPAVISGVPSFRLVLLKL